MNQDIVKVKLKISVPKSRWLSKLNDKYPELRFHILSTIILEENVGDTLFQIQGPTVKNFISEFNSISEPASFQILYEDKEAVILNVKTKDPWIFNSLVKTDLLIMYPIKISEGQINIEAITTRMKVDNFLLELEKKEMKFSIISIGYYHQSALLTKRQKDLLHFVYINGYFEVPRKKSLTKLAKDLNISPSALSETLRRTFKRITKNYLENAF